MTVYLGSSGFARDIFKNDALDMGARIGLAERHLVYGGMDAGLMGLVAQAALDNGAKVTGIVPKKIKDSERILKGLTETILVEDLWDRKRRMFYMADALVALPGGFGTADETLEALYWGNLRLHGKMVVFVNTDGYWDEMIGFLKSLPDFNPDYCLVVNDPSEVFDALDKATPPKGPDVLPERFPHFEDEITRKTPDPIIVAQPSVESAYYLICALGLKQLGKHARPIGILNGHGQFDALLRWLERAAAETFITQKCLKLFDVGTDEAALRESLKHQSSVQIDLHREKWGAELITKS